MAMLASMGVGDFIAQQRLLAAPAAVELVRHGAGDYKAQSACRVVLAGEFNAQGVCDAGRKRRVRFSPRL